MLANRVRMGSSDKEYKLMAGDIVAYQNTNEVAQTGTTYVKKREIRVNEVGTVKILFNLRIGSAGRVAYGKIYINGIDVGTEQSTRSTSLPTSYVEFTENFAVESGDLIQLYVCTDSPFAVTVYNNLFQIKVKKLPPAGTFEQTL